MNMDANPFALAEFVENPEPRCPCLLLLDVSASMSGRRIQELNQGLKGFEASLKADSLSARRVEVAIVTFGDVQVYQDFTSAAHFIAPELHAEGLTPMGEAVETAIHLLRHRKNLYRQAGISYYRPWIFMITDGTPTDNIANARAAIAVRLAVQLPQLAVALQPRRRRGADQPHRPERLGHHRLSAARPAIPLPP